MKGRMNACEGLPERRKWCLLGQKLGLSDKLQLSRGSHKGFS